MAKFWLRSSPIPALQFNKQFAISKTLILNPNICKISEPYNNPGLSRDRFQCCKNSTSSIELHESPSFGIFIKGLSQSTSEGSLRSMLSHCGEISEVKMKREKKSGQSLGYAYVWFNSEESAQVAVKEMNGKFFDGRFVFVTLARPFSSKSGIRTAPYKF